MLLSQIKWYSSLREPPSWMAGSIASAATVERGVKMNMPPVADVFGSVVQEKNTAGSVPL